MPEPGPKAWTPKASALPASLPDGAGVRQMAGEKRGPARLGSGSCEFTSQDVGRRHEPRAELTTHSAAQDGTPVPRIQWIQTGVCLPSAACEAKHLGLRVHRPHPPAVPALLPSLRSATPRVDGALLPPTSFPMEASIVTLMGPAHTLKRPLGRPKTPGRRASPCPGGGTPEVPKSPCPRHGPQPTTAWQLVDKTPASSPLS
nr:nascent polypeptide-associated complex subunit alpha, muscle-specific form-like [Equus asinus]